ncbi:MAG: amino acid hydroxymethyltransferase [Clostridia bacterium]
MRKQIYEDYLKILKDMKVTDAMSIPLCAAQTHISNFCKQPLTSDFEGKYSFIDETGENSFIGGECVESLNRLLAKQCKIIFDCDYVNADTLTGVNCFSVVAMALLKSGMRVLLTTPEQGGHPSIPIILEHLSITYDEIPYDFKNYQIDYKKTNKMIKLKKYDFIIFCQSDILQIPDISLIEFNGTGVIYDATQTLGLISGKAVSNPLSYSNAILIGGTHKTLPAPACGIVMTNNKQYINLLKQQITPSLLRNTQPNHIAGLLLSLIEQEEFGSVYQTNVVVTANLLASKLEQLGLKVAKLDKKIYSQTHQIFILLDETSTNLYFNNAKLFNITLNKKNKKLFNNTGIRIGVQQIARYNWGEDELSELARLLFLLLNSDENKNEILEIRKKLISKKTPKFELSEIIIE